MSSSHWPVLTSLSPPWIWLTAREVSDPLISLSPSQADDCCIRRLRGLHIIDQSSLHNELAAAFQFPWYYGRNINAAVDCLRDLAWCEKAHRSFLVVVTEAHSLVNILPNTLEIPSSIS